MAMQKLKKTKKLSKKSFYSVEAPLISVKINLYGSSAEEFDGKTIRIDLTKSLRGKSLELKMRVKNIDGKLIAEPISLNLVSSYLRRNMRTGIDYVEDSFVVECRDITARVKPFLLTRKKVSRAVRKALREEAKKYIEGHIKIRDRKEVFSDIMTNKLQRGLSLKLKKTYPLALCEIRAFEVISVKDAVGDSGEQERVLDESDGSGKNAKRRAKDIEDEMEEMDEMVVEEESGEEEILVEDEEKGEE